MLPKPSFLHTVSAESRCFESAFEKTIFIRDRLQKLRNLLLFQLFYSITFLMPKTLLSRENVCPCVQNGRNRTPRVGKVAVAAVPCVFSVRMSKKHCFCPADRLSRCILGSLALPGGSSRLAGCLCVPLGAPGCPWRPLAAPGAPWCPLAAPGGSWRFLAAAWLPLAAPGGSGAPWRLLAPPGCPWRLPLALPGWPSKFAFSLRFPSVFCDSRAWLAFKIRILAAIPKCFL
jgi:hypothetical protein